MKFQPLLCTILISLQTFALTSCAFLLNEEPEYFDGSGQRIELYNSSFKLARAEFIEIKGRRIPTKHHFRRLLEHDLHPILGETGILLPISGSVETVSEWSGVKLANGDIFVCGGRLSNNKPLLKTYIYDPVKKKTLEGPKLAVATCEPELLILQDGRILITGGFDHVNTKPLSESQIYDPNKRSIVKYASMNIPRVKHAVTQLSVDKVLVVAGKTMVPGGVAKPTASVELLDLEAGEFKPIAALQLALWSPTLIVLDDTTAIVAGGWYEMNNQFKDVRWNRITETIRTKARSSTSR